MKIPKQTVIGGPGIGSLFSDFERRVGINGSLCPGICQAS